MGEFVFNSGLIKRFSRENEKNVLSAYHYTSPDAYRSIIDSGFVRFSDIEYMNDKTETVYAVKKLLDFLDKYPGEYLFTREVLSVLINEQSYSNIQELKVSSITFNDIQNIQQRKIRSFLFCMSTKKDSLNMWNYYVQNGHYEGFAIGFDLYEFLKTFDTYSEKETDAFIVRHGKVLYKEEFQFDVIKNIIDYIENMQYRGIDPILPFAATMLRIKLEGEGLFIKHPEFKSEQEYRIVIQIAETRIPHCEEDSKKYFGANNKLIQEDFCSRKGLIVPFLKVKIPENSITKTIVSPITEFALAEKGVKEFLTVKGFKNATVEQSKIPIRF